MYIVVQRAFVTAALGLALAAVSPSASAAAELDCTSASGCTGSTGSPLTDDGVDYWSFAGALWTTSDNQATGSGVIDSFVRISGNTGIVDGHNTSGRPLAGDENNSPTFTHDLQVGQVPIVEIAGTNYYEFLLDINQTGTDPLLSLDGLKICVQDGSGLVWNANTFCGPGTPSYSLDGITDNYTLLNYNLNSGSGSGDLFVYIPTVTLGLDETKYVYLWSQFGSTPDYENNDGYEEWAVRENLGTPGGCFGDCPEPLPGVPEPASLLLLGTGLVIGAGTIRRRTRRAARASQQNQA